jgi:hypothetical protein
MEIIEVKGPDMNQFKNGWFHDWAMSKLMTKGVVELEKYPLRSGKSF